jgi:glycosyltransferase involved in cell wall biosynthesis
MPDAIPVSPSPVPEVSIVIPVYNEEAILHAAVVDLRERLEGSPFTWELILAENGSSDGTVSVAMALAARYPEVSHFSLHAPNCRGRWVICEEVDLCDVSFHLQAIQLLRTSDTAMVIGSKLLGASHDERPWLRHAASQLYTGLLRLGFGFRGTDTHGLKAFDRVRLRPVLDECVVDRDVFASELVIRACRQGLPMLEIPVRVLEKRPPSINLLRRIPGVISRLGRLAWAIHRG